MCITSHLPFVVDDFKARHVLCSCPLCSILLIRPEINFEMFLFVCFSPCSSGEWEHWTQRVQEYIYPDDEVPEYSSILVPNVDNVRTNFLMDTIAKQHKVKITLAHIL